MKELSEYVQRRVMIIDDSRPILDTLRMFLEGEGYEVFTFEDPCAAIAAGESLAPTVVLTDIRMPQMTGLDVLREIRSRDARTPIILMTGHADMTTAIEAVKRGAFDFILKPFDLECLGIALERAVRFRAVIEWEKHYVQSLEETVAERTASLRETIADLTEAKRKAEEASRLKSEFLTNITHEIRTPVNGISGMIELALTEEDAAERLSLLRDAMDSATRLMNVIEGLLSFSLVSSEKTNKDIFSPRNLLDAAMARQTPLARRKNLAVTLAVAPTVPEHLYGNGRHLSLLLDHVIGNAVKFTPTGTIAVRVSWDAPDLLHLEVADTGIGIPPDQREKVLEPFRQADGSLTRRFEGAGLGLAIVRKIVESADGSVTIGDNPGGGTICTCRMRFETAAAG